MGAPTFTGYHEHSVDAKGRTSLPSEFREVLSELYEDDDKLSLMITEGFDGNIVAYPKQAWEELVETLLKTGMRARGIKRKLVGRARKCMVDKQGRVIIPQALRDCAGIGKDLAWVGMLDKIEIWDVQRLEEKENQDQEKIDIDGLIDEIGL